MQWEFMIALVLGVPIILLPVALIWYLNLGGVWTSITAVRRRRAALRKATAGAEKGLASTGR